MPPRTVKRGAASKRATKATRGATKVQNQQHPEAHKESVKDEEVETKEVKEDEVKEEQKAVPEEKPIDSVEKKLDTLDNGFSDASVDMKTAAIASVQIRKEDEVKDDEYEKDECLDLDDNEPEYEPEEYCGADYDEKEIEQEDVHEVVDEGLEDPEENEGEDDETEMHEDMEDVLEEHEVEEDDETAGDDRDHVGVVDVEDEEHHELVKERRKRKEYEVFVGGLDKDASEKDLREVFRSVGEVTEVRLMMNPQTKKNKGFAFLRFATVEQARRAVIELKNPVINGKQCGVTPSEDSDTLFLGNICKTWTKEALKEKLKHYGLDNVDDLTLVEDSNNVGMNRGFAFLEFSSRSDAMEAFKRLQKRDVVFGVDRPAKVSFADSFIDPGDEIMAQVKTVFVDGLPTSWDEEYVRDLLKKYGGVEKVELARNMPSAKRKDFGFVTFDTHDAAVMCAKSINNVELGEGDNKAKVRVRLSRPLQRGRGKNVGRGDFWSGHGSGRVLRGSWGRPTPRSLPMRAPPHSRTPSAIAKRPFGVRERRPVMSIPARGRPYAPVPRSHDRRALVSSHPKSSGKREYVRREEVHPPRNRVAADYGSRVIPDRRTSTSYKDEYSFRDHGYSDVSRGASRTTSRRAYVDDGYGQRFERPPPSYRQGHDRDYEPTSGSKRPYASLDDVAPRYTDANVRQSRARLEYEYGGGASQYEDAYGDRLGRSNLGYGSSRGSMSSQDSHGLYGSRQVMGYGGGSFGGSYAGGMYSSSYGGDYVSRTNDAGASSYSSIYPGRSVGGSSYMGGGGSGSYY